MRPVRELTGQRFGQLTVTGPAGKSADGRLLWHCRCDCGKTIVVRGYSLTSGGTRSCGCSRIRDLSGQRFGRLVALRPTGETRATFAVWECRCDCGATAFVTSGDLTTGNTRSCGCAVSAPRPSMQRDLTGRRFGRLTALRPTDQRKNGYVVWECRCDCGATVFVRSPYLTGGKTTSCGCARRKAAPAQVPLSAD